MWSGLGANALVPAKETFITRAGFGSYLRNAGLKILLPCILGVGLGTAIFGDLHEIVKLNKMRRQYTHEMSNYVRELYYS